jgi:hypothetical protein
MTIVILNLAWLKQQHERLAYEIGDLRRWCEAESTKEYPNYGEMCLRVMKLRHRLMDHLDAEERRGCFWAAVSAEPELQGQVAELLAQHRYFRQALDDLGRKLAQGKAVYRELREAYDELETVLAELQQHERAETAILESAFGREALTSANKPSLPFRPR